LEELRANKENDKIKIIILSNLSGEKEIEKSKTLGADDYIIKAGINMSDIVNKIKVYLQE
jgi:DNA-binding response OmpR family regulator